MQNLENWIRKGNKEGGVNSAGLKGGIYTYQEKTALIKREDENAKNIAEFLGARFHNFTVPNNSPEVLLVNTGNEEKPKSSKDVYIASVFFDNYKDLYKDIYEKLELPVPINKPGHGSTTLLRVVQPELERGLKENNYQDFAKVVATSLLIGDYDMHWGNIGVVNDTKLVRIDFGADFRNLPHSMQPEKATESFDGFKPHPNFFRTFPQKVKRSPELIEELERVSKLDFQATIKASIEELANFYSPEEIKDFAIKLGMKKDDLNPSEEVTDKLEEYLTNLTQNRQQSLKDFAVELKIANCFYKENGNVMCYDVKLKDIFTDNFDFITRVINGKTSFHMSVDHLSPETNDLKKIFLEILDVINEILPEKLQFNTDKKFMKDLIENSIAHYAAEKNIDISNLPSKFADKITKEKIKQEELLVR